MFVRKPLSNLGITPLHNNRMTDWCKHQKHFKKISTYFRSQKGGKIFLSTFLQKIWWNANITENIHEDVSLFRLGMCTMEHLDVLEYPESLCRIQNIESNSSITADLQSAMHQCTPSSIVLDNFYCFWLATSIATIIWNYQLLALHYH